VSTSGLYEFGLTESRRHQSAGNPVPMCCSKMDSKSLFHLSVLQSFQLVINDIAYLQFRLLVGVIISQNPFSIATRPDDRVAMWLDEFLFTSCSSPLPGLLSFFSLQLVTDHRSLLRKQPCLAACGLFQVRLITVISGLALSLTGVNVVPMPRLT
jgi:hypothetical protein